MVQVLGSLLPRWGNPGSHTECQAAGLDLALVRRCLGSELAKGKKGKLLSTICQIKKDENYVNIFLKEKAWFPHLSSQAIIDTHSNSHLSFLPLYYMKLKWPLTKFYAHTRARANSFLQWDTQRVSKGLCFMEYFLNYQDYLNWATTTYLQCNSFSQSPYFLTVLFNHLGFFFLSIFFFEKQNYR